MRYTVRRIVMLDGEIFAECSTKREVEAAVDSANNVGGFGAKITVVEVEPYEVEYDD